MPSPRDTLAGIIGSFAGISGHQAFDVADALIGDHA